MPNASEKELVWVGQIATVVLVLVSLGWIPFMQTLMGGGIFHYLQSIQAYISPPIAAVFIFGLYYKWINARGAITSLWIGFVLGISRLVLEFLNKEGKIVVEQDSVLGTFLYMNFLHYAIFLFIVSAAVLMLISRMGVPQSEEVLRLVTFQKGKSKGKFKLSGDIILTIILILMVLIIWTVFSTWGIA